MTVIKKIPLSLRLPSSLVAWLGAYAEENGITRTEAFEHFLNLGLAASNDDALERRLKRIEATTDELGALLRRLMAKEGLLQRVSASDVIAAINDTARHFPAIEEAYLFGSFARGDADEESDVDIRVCVAKDGRFSLRDLDQFAKRIEQKTGRDVDVVSARDIKNKALAKAIEEEGILAYERETQ